MKGSSQFFAPFCAEKRPGVRGPEPRITWTHGSIRIARGESALFCTVSPGSRTSLVSRLSTARANRRESPLGRAKGGLGGLWGVAPGMHGVWGAQPPRMQEVRGAQPPGMQAGAGGRSPPSPVESSNLLLPAPTLLGVGWGGGEGVGSWER